jgi:Uma2 family endonuclease
MAMPLTHRRFTVDEYHRMAETGILTPDDRVELLDGQIVPMTPIGVRHAACVTALTNLLAPAMVGRGLLSPQNPVRLDRFGEPQPDIAVLAPRADGYRSRHPGPGDVLLLIEVADASVESDRKTKIPLYARHAIPEVWLVDLTAGRIEVYREPTEGEYAHRQVLDRGATLRPHLLPFLSIEASEILG